MGIAIHNVSTSGHDESGTQDLASAIRQDASGWLGTTVTAGDMVRLLLFYLICVATAIII